MFASGIHWKRTVSIEIEKLERTPKLFVDVASNSPLFQLAGCTGAERCVCSV
jgi:hypothetical protein